MSNIITYPAISVVTGQDLMIISDTSIKGNPTKTVSVDALGSYIGATGGGAGVATVNGVSGAVTLVGGTGVDLVVAGQNITINSASSGGTVTSLDVDRTSGDSTLIGGVLNVPNYGSGGIVTSLDVDRTSGDSTLVGGVLNIPNYANTTNFNVASDTGTTIAMAAGYTLNIVGGTGIDTVVGNPGVGARSTINLSNIIGVEGNYTNSNLTVDAQGRIIAAADGSGSGGLASVSSGTGLISTGTSSDPTINIDLSGNNNYILSGTGNNAVAGGDKIPYSDVDTKTVQYFSVTSLINGGIGYTSAALKLSPLSSAAPSLTVLHNSIGGTFSIVRSSAGVYTLSNSSSVFSLSTVCFITNPNAQAPSSGTGSLPQPTTIERFGSGVTVSDLRINCFRVETGTVSGSPSDFGIGKDVMVEVRIYGASS